MNFGLLGKAAGKLGTTILKNSSTICTVAGGIGVVLTAVEAGRATLQAHDTLVAHEMDEELKTEKYESVPGEDIKGPIVYYRKRTAWETFRLVWRCYIITVLLGGGTIACILGAHSIDTKRRVALAAAYRLSEEAARDFRNKVTETIGEKKVRKIDSDIMQDKVQKTPLPDDDNLIFTGNGDQLMYDAWSGRYFKSSQLNVEKAVNTLNKIMIAKKCSLSMNDYYETIGIPVLSNAVGDEFGWNYHQFNEGEDVTVDFYPVFSPKQEPCIGVKFDPELLYTYGEI